MVKALFEGKPYDAKTTEARIYAAWEASGFFDPDNLPGKRTKNYVVYMPLPNVTGSLHMGHALDNTVQDILVRYHRLRGRRALWLPGTDHAGISTQYVVEKTLKKEGISRFDLGREKFVARVWEWKKRYGDLIIGQLKKLGCSADWSRARFTMDPGYARDVTAAFVHYHEKGLIYRGLRTVNWCPRCGTSLSELELEYETEKTKLWYIKYPLAGSPGEFLSVATTRPETMLGDTAVAVNDKDERYKKFVGKSVVLPIQNRDIPVVADSAIDPAFGTGAVKVTPAHDTADFMISLAHKLPLIQVIDERGKMTQEAGEFAGLSTAAAREKVVERLQSLGLMEKIEDYEHRVAKCGRCGHTIEPIPSRQWFLKMDGLAKTALHAVKSGAVAIHPENFRRTYEAWLGNVRDWTISRQIWWGHRLPVWFEKNDPEKYVVSAEKPKGDFVQSEDVLDTWFSSALWPFAGLSDEDRKKYYPGDTLATARDIVNLWVARMIFSGLEFMGHVPFKDVFIHGTILTREGKRMSKSLGTGVDPLRYIDEYGADATRFAVIWQASGQDIHWDEAALAAGRKFLNKLWNASRFVLTKTEGVAWSPQSAKAKTDADREILRALADMSERNERAVAAFEFNTALKDLYDFFWHDFCDVYLEASKPQLENPETRESTAHILHAALFESLILLHPFLPFITEEIYANLPERSAAFLMTELTA